jgi:hypothetical protein
MNSSELFASRIRETAAYETAKCDDSMNVAVTGATLEAAKTWNQLAGIEKTDMLCARMDLAVAAYIGIALGQKDFTSALFGNPLEALRVAAEADGARLFVLSALNLYVETERPLPAVAMRFMLSIAEKRSTDLAKAIDAQFASSLR